MNKCWPCHRIFIVFFVGIAIQGVSNTLYAQRDLHVGIETGPSMINLWGNDLLENKAYPNYFKYKSDAGFSSGMFLRYRFHKNMSIQTGCTYNMNGFYSEVIGTPTHYAKMRLDYINFPLFFRLEFGKSMRYFFTLGGFFEYLTYARQIVSPHFSGNTTETAYEVTPDFKRFNTGALFGVGMEYTFLNNISLGLHIRNQLGLFNISELPVTNNQSVRTNSLQFMLNVAYAFNKK